MLRLNFASGGMDKIDLVILEELQRDATTPIAEIGQKAGLSLASAWRRIQKLEQSGVIERRVALCNPVKLNVATTVFVTISAAQHSPASVRRVIAAIEGWHEVVECYRLSGEIDYLLKVVVPDIATFDAFYMKLIAAADLADVSSSFAMERIKYSTALPVNFAGLSRN
jgi:Lrp/AsnC family transcriptional regulator